MALEISSTSENSIVLILLSPGTTCIANNCALVALCANVSAVMLDETDRARLFHSCSDARSQVGSGARSPELSASPFAAVERGFIDFER